MFNPPRLQGLPDAAPIKFGILGAARIAPDALIAPARSHPEVAIYAVAARDEKKARAFGKKHGIPKVYAGPNGYQGMLHTLNYQNYRADIEPLLRFVG